MSEEKAVRWFGLEAVSCEPSGRSRNGKYKSSEAPPMRVQLPQQAGYGQDQHGANDNGDLSKGMHDRPSITTMDSWIECDVK